MRPQNPNKISLCLMVTCLLFLFVINISVQARDTKAPAVETVQQQVSFNAKDHKGFLGKATYYANRYNGRRTSSGEIFNQRLMTDHARRDSVRRYASVQLEAKRRLLEGKVVDLTGETVKK